MADIVIEVIFMGSLMMLLHSSLFLTLLTLSDRLFLIQLSLPSFINIALPASSGLHSFVFSLCFLQRSLPVCCHIKQRQSHTLKLKNQDRTHGTKKITTILLYLCLFSSSHLSYCLDYKHSLCYIVKMLVHCES